MIIKSLWFLGVLCVTFSCRRKIVIYLFILLDCLARNMGLRENDRGATSGEIGLWWHCQRGKTISRAILGAWRGWTGGKSIHALPLVCVWAKQKAGRIFSRPSLFTLLPAQYSSPSAADSPASSAWGGGSSPACVSVHSPAFHPRRAWRALPLYLWVRKWVMRNPFPIGCAAR